ncbi:MULTISPECIES: phosphohistidine phosphatase SixA [Ferrimonas]|uniref:phosphohistidine phosphatase SixA n=1 Tax=Ferrimonas TaxID=44011 RepID=UPI00040D50FC|nr:MULTISPECIES: phosphohistidine phosphatase SixA [Ferrimonas]USD36672.1 phosphohistidine phosphatase SixA [Ferrimonas sp. SCSIO 43195]
MRFYLMRHGEAGFDATVDSQRNLTDLGQREVLHMGARLARELGDCRLVLVSPYVRAQQSWRCLQASLPEDVEVITLDELVPNADPGVSHDVIAAHAELSATDAVLVVAHMPLLAYLLREFVAGIEPPLFATAAVASVEVSDGSGRLLALQSPTVPAVL